MAETNVSKTIKQHIEKAIVGVCGLLLLYGIFHWGTSSPREVEVRTFAPPGSVTLRPSQLDAEVAKEVNALAGMIALEQPPQPPLPNYVTSVRAAMTPITPTLLVSLSLPHWPLASMTEGSQLPAPTRAELEKIAVAPSSPQVNAEQVLPNHLPLPLADKTVACGSLTWAWGDQLKAWTEKLKGTNVAAYVTVAGQEIERQERNPDGSWGGSEIVKLDPVPLVDTGGREAIPPQVAVFDGTNYQAVYATIQELKNPVWQQQILQPEYAKIYWPFKLGWVDWRVNLPPTELNLAEGPETEAPVIPSGASAEAPVGPAPPLAGPTAPPPPSITTPPAGTAGGGRRTREMINPGAAPGPAAPAPGAKPATPVVDARAPMLYPNPTFAKQLDMGKVNAWFCDQTLQPGKVYRYRQRLKLVNPLLTMTDDVKDKADAAEPFIFTPWSDWSSDVAAPRSAEFFVTGGSEARGNIQVAIFSFYMGQVVEQSLQVTPGQAIGKLEKIDVANPIAPGKLPDPKPVDFSTGCVAVDINFAKPVYGRSELSKTIKTIELLYVDGGGRLGSKLQQLDSNSEIYKDLLRQSGTR